MKKINYLISIFFLLITVSIYADTTDDLITACMQGDIDGVKTALNAGADVNKANASGATAISVAYFWPEITKLLIEKGADVNGGMMPALVSASSCHSVDVVKMLLDAGADPNKKGEVNMKAFWQSKLDEEKAKGKGQANKALVSMYETQIKNAKNTEAYALQNLLMGTNCTKILQMLIDKGMKMELQDGTTALQIYSTYGQTSVARKAAWAQAEAGYAAFGMKMPEWAINLSDEVNAPYGDMFEIILKHNKDVNKTDANGYPPLYHVLRRAVTSSDDQTEVVGGAKALINAGANVKSDAVTATEAKGTISTPLCLAVGTGDIEFVKLVIEKGADLNESVRNIAVPGYSQYASYSGEGGSGYTPLVIAVMTDRTEIAKLLVEKGADIKIGVHGFAVLESNAQNLKCLCTVKNKTPLYWAIERDNKDLINYFSDMPDAKKIPDFTALTLGDVATGDTYNYKCVKLKKSKYAPSEYAEQIGNEDAANVLAAKKL